VNGRAIASVKPSEYGVHWEAVVRVCGHGYLVYTMLRGCRCAGETPRSPFPAPHSGDIPSRKETKGAAADGIGASAAEAPKERTRGRSAKVAAEGSSATPRPSPPRALSRRPRSSRGRQMATRATAAKAEQLPRRWKVSTRSTADVGVRKGGRSLRPRRLPRRFDEDPGRDASKEAPSHSSVARRMTRAAALRENPVCARHAAFSAKRKATAPADTERRQKRRALGCSKCRWSKGGCSVCRGEGPPEAAQAEAEPAAAACAREPLFGDVLMASCMERLLRIPVFPSCPVVASARLRPRARIYQPHCAVPPSALLPVSRPCCLKACAVVACGRRLPLVA